MTGNALLCTTQRYGFVIMKINRGYVARLLAATDAAEALAQLSSLWSTRTKVSENGELIGLSSAEMAACALVLRRSLQRRAYAAWRPGHESNHCRIIVVQKSPRRCRLPFERAFHSDSKPVPFKTSHGATRHAIREIRHVPSGFRLFAPWKSLRPMRQADCSARLDRKQSWPHVLPLDLPCLRLPVRGHRYLP